MNQKDQTDLQNYLNGTKELPNLVELRDPEQLVPLAATQLQLIHPEIDKMVILMCCRRALNQLVNVVMEKRSNMISSNFTKRFEL